MIKWTLALLVSAGLAYAQQSANVYPQPDCSIVLNLTGAGNAPANQTAGGPADNRNQGCNLWSLSYSISSGISTATFALQSAANNNGAPGTWLTYADQTVMVGSNPNTITSGSGFMTLIGYEPWVRINVSSVTGSGAITGAAYGWRRQNPTASVGIYCPDTSGSTTAYACPSPTPVPTSYQTGMLVIFVPEDTNTSTTPTIDIAGLGVENIKAGPSTDVTVGALVGGDTYLLGFDGSEFLVNAGTGGAPTSAVVNGVTCGTCSVGQLWDSNGNPSVETGTTASAVNFLEVTDAAAGTPAIVNVAGAGTSSGVGLNIQGKNASLNGQVGGVSIAGGNQTSTSGSASNASAGGVSIEGGDNAASHSASQAGSVELQGGDSPNGGEQGVTQIGNVYTIGSGTTTQWNFQCLVSGGNMLANDCGASPTTALGVADAKSATVVEIHVAPSETPINASAAVTLGHTVCLGAASPKVTDSGGTGPCSTGLTVGQVIATSGEWIFGDGVTASISTSLPMVQLYKHWALGTGDLPAQMTQTIASGATALPTGTLSSATCASTTTVSATGVLSTDIIIFTPNATLTASTGYAPSTSGGLTINAFPTANNVNFDQCNWSTGNITPSAVTVNWRVVR